MIFVFYIYSEDSYSKLVDLLNIETSNNDESELNSYNKIITLFNL